MQLTVLRYDQKRHTPLVQPSMHESCEISGTLPAGESEKRSGSCRTLKTVGRSCTVSGPELQWSQPPVSGGTRSTIGWLDDLYTTPISVIPFEKVYTLYSTTESRGREGEVPGCL